MPAPSTSPRMNSSSSRRPMLRCRPGVSCAPPSGREGRRGRARRRWYGCSPGLVTPWHESDTSPRRSPGGPARRVRPTRGRGPAGRPVRADHRRARRSTRAPAGPGAVPGPGARRSRAARPGRPPTRRPRRRPGPRCSRQPDHHLDQLEPDRVAAAPRDQGRVDLDDLRPDREEPTQVTVAAAEVVHGQRGAPLPQELATGLRPGASGCAGVQPRPPSSSTTTPVRSRGTIAQKRGDARAAGPTWTKSADPSGRPGKARARQSTWASSRSPYPSSCARANTRRTSASCGNRADASCPTSRPSGAETMGCRTTREESAQVGQHVAGGHPGRRDDAVAPQPLGLVQRGVGGADRRARLRRRVPHRDPGGEGLRTRGHPAEGLHDGTGLVAAQARQQDRELLAAVASQEAGVRRELGRPRRRRPPGAGGRPPGGRARRCSA
jgi:hypothetical protein